MRTPIRTVLALAIMLSVALPILPHRAAEADYYGCAIFAMQSPPTNWVGRQYYSTPAWYTGGIYSSLSQNYHPYPGSVQGHSSAFVQIADDSSPTITYYMKTGMWGGASTNKVYREYISGAQPWMHAEFGPSVTANPYEYYTVLYDRYSMNPRGQTRTQYAGVTWGITITLYPGVPRLSQVLGETAYQNDQMPGDRVMPFYFTGTKYYSVIDGSSAGTWMWFSGSPVNSNPTLYGTEYSFLGQFMIWDNRCP